MIYTVTFNPSIDYIVKVKELNLGTVNRVEKEEYYPGGKGINVSLMLKNLGAQSMALGFIAGFTGREIERQLTTAGCSSSFIEVEEGLSRINIKIKAEEESEINGQGPKIERRHLEKLYTQLDSLKDGDVLVLAGSIPQGLPEDVYENICDRLKHIRVNIVVDATKVLLMKVLKYKPFLIKPNKQELEELFDTKLISDEEIIDKAFELQRLGARNVLISMGGEGAILLSHQGRLFKAKAPSGTVINSVGAGDSMVAGFLKGYLNKGDIEEAFKLGVAAGSASAFSSWFGTKAEVLRIFNEIQL